MTDLTRNTLQIGRLKVELLENNHLQVENRGHIGRHEPLIVDVACLSPQLAIAAPGRLLTLRLAQLAAVGIAGAVFFSLLRSGSVELAGHTFAVIVLLSAAAFGVLLNYRAMKQIWFRTRFTGLLLFTIPVPRRRRRDVETFLSLIHERMREVETKRGLTREQLRSGELRTLRRLASERLIPVKMYEEAKLSLLN